MKRVALLIVAGLLCCAPGWADPYLVYVPSSPTDEPEWYEVEGATWTDEEQPCEEDLSLRLPLKPMPSGQVYQLRVRSCNSAGCSEWAEQVTLFRTDGMMYRTIGDDYTGIKYYADALLHKSEGPLRVEDD